MEFRSVLKLAIFGCCEFVFATTALSQVQFSKATLITSERRRPITEGTNADTPTVSKSSEISNLNGIEYNGGPIIDDASGVHVYFIWYGDWSHDRQAKRILENFIMHLGGTPYFAVDTTYYSLSQRANGEREVKDRVVNAVHYRGSVEDRYSQGSNLTGNQVYLAVSNAILSGALPADRNGVYFLLSSSDVSESGFGTRHCGWHSSGEQRVAAGRWDHLALRVRG